MGGLLWTCHSTEGQTEAQRGAGTCLRLHSWAGAELSGTQAHPHATLTASLLGICHGEVRPWHTLGCGGAHPAPPEREATPGQSSTPGHKWDWMDLGQVGWGSPSGERLSQFLGRRSRWQVLGKLGCPRRPRGWEGVEWWPQRYVHIPSPRSCKCDRIWNSHLCGCYKVKDLEVRPSWMGLKSRDTFLIRNERRRRHGQRPCGDSDRAWKGAAGRGRKEPPAELPEAAPSG